MMASSFETARLGSDVEVRVRGDERRRVRSPDSWTDHPQYFRQLGPRANARHQLVRWTLLEASTSPPAPPASSIR